MTHHRTITRAIAGPLRFAAEPGSDMRAFHRAMDTEPTNQLHPLVYADWLEERGMPTAAHIIRLHVENTGYLQSKAFDSGFSHSLPARCSPQPGEFVVQAGVRPVPGVDPALLLRHGSLSTPGRYYLWRLESHDGLHGLIDALRAEGHRTTPVTDREYPPRKQ